MLTYTAFDHFKKISSGSLEKVALELKKFSKSNKEAQVLIFSDLTGRQIDLDLSGSDKDVVDRLKVYAPQIQPTQTKAGRPKLGVIPREISLLPQHWEWLINQDGGASSTIRKLIDEKIKTTSEDKNKIKISQEVTYKFLSALAGNLTNFEEATRFLYRKDKIAFEKLISDWPSDVKKYTLRLSEEVFK